MDGEHKSIPVVNRQERKKRDTDFLFPGCVFWIMQVKTAACAARSLWTRLPSVWTRSPGSVEENGTFPECCCGVAASSSRCITQFQQA